MSSVKLISYSQPHDDLKEQGIVTLDHLIAFCARVSNPDNQNNTETMNKLISYMIRHKHFSPFEMVHICMEITTTRDIARQILRHRSFSFQEYSGRYAEMNASEELRELRLQDPKNRQNSISTDDVDTERYWIQLQRQVLNTAYQNYNKALGAGVAKEQARALLPEGLTESTMYMAGTLRSWIHYVEVRTEEGVQKEHKEIAEKVKAVLVDLHPFLKDYFNG